MSDNKNYKDISCRHAAESIYKICKEENLDYGDKIELINNMISRVVKNEINKITLDSLLEGFKDN